MGVLSPCFSRRETAESVMIAVVPQSPAYLGATGLVLGFGKGVPSQSFPSGCPRTRLEGEDTAQTGSEPDLLPSKSEC